MLLPKWVKAAALGAALVLIVVVAGIFFVRQQGRADIAGSQSRPSLRVTSLTFANGQNIPSKFTCDGTGTSPEMQLPSPPDRTKSFALVMEDLDAPLGFVHWLVYNIPSGMTEIVEGASSQRKLPPGAAEGINSLDTVGYTGPCPPGTTPHRYTFRLYALDTSLSLPPRTSKRELAKAVAGHVVAEGQLTGLYVRHR